MTKETGTGTVKGETPTPKETATAQQGATQAEPTEFPFQLPLAELGDMNNNAFEAYLRTSRAILENAAAVNQEMMRFAGERFQADLEAIQTLPGYTNIPGVMNFQSEFMRRAADAYQAEFSKLMQQNSEAVSTIFEPLLQAFKDAGLKGLPK